MGDPFHHLSQVLLMQHPSFWLLALGFFLPPSAGVAAGPAKLTLWADATCSLTVAGKAQGELSPGNPRTLDLPAGNAEVSCTSPSWSDATARAEVKLAAGETTTTRLRLRWASTQVGVLDREQRIYWTAQDNGADIDWPSAGAWCKGLGEGWRLPSRDELSALYAGAAGETVPCSNAQCKVPALFQLTSYWMWAAELTPQGDARYVYLSTGHPQSAKPDYKLKARALCVRPA